MLHRKVFGDPGRSRRRTPACDGPITVRDPEAAQVDVEHLQAALGNGQEAFLNAASPGVIALFFRNDHYATREEYVFAIAEAMRVEYEAVTGAGVLVQIDCPDLAMGRHIQFADKSLSEFRDEARLNIEALNHATRNIDPELLRMHVCWGNYEGPHHCDVPFADIVDLVFTARPAAIAFEAANPRHAHEWQIFEDVKLPDGKVLIPGVLESKANFIEHPELIAQRIRRYAGPRRRRERARRERLRLRHLGGPGRRRSRRRVGEARRAHRGRGDRLAPARTEQRASVGFHNQGL